MSVHRQLPRGFRGTVQNASALLPDAAAAQRLTTVDRTFAAALSALDGAGAIVVPALTESMGAVEGALTAIAARLAGGGALVLDVENAQSLRQLRSVLEGRPGSFDPAGSIEDPAQALPLRRVLQAAAAAGLLVTDVVRVPTPAAEVAAGFAGAMFRQGFLAIDWLDGAPAWRFWIAARKQHPIGGSVLIAGGDAAARDRTAAVVRAFLPGDWETVVAVEDAEREGFDRAVAQSRGDLLWFLRGGAEPSAGLFEELSLYAMLGPCAPGKDGERTAPGDLCGTMLQRVDVLRLGPLPDAPTNTAIAHEEYLIRLEACSPETRLVDVPFATPPAPIESPSTFAAEADALMQRWQPIGLGKKRHESQDDPRVRRARPEAPWAGREPRISLCMIARNEERFLPECLARAREVVDEIVLVDTGSTDRTVEIAESFGAKVLHAPWNDDFSTPRNLGIGAATGDWILVLDADEFLQPGAAARIRELVRDPGVAGYHLRFTNVYTGGKTMGVVMVRLFRNLPGIEFKNLIHEQVTPSLLAAGASLGLILSVGDVEVEHHGYTDEVMASRSKNERNERLFRRQLERTPDDIYTLYKYGDFLRRVAGRAEDAQRLLEKCFDLLLESPPSLPREVPYAGEVAALCALHHVQRGAVARAREIVDLALRRFLPTPNLHYIAASVAVTAGRNDAAIAHFQRCLAYRGQVLVVPVQDGITGHVALAGIAQALLQQGDDVRAERLLRRAIAMQPSYEVSHLLLSRLFVERGDPLAALRTLTAFLTEHPHSAGACQQTTLLLQRLGCRDQARRMGERAVELLRENADEQSASRMKALLAAM